MGEGRKQPIDFNIIHHNVKFGKNPVIRQFIFIGEGCIFGDNVRISNHCVIDKGCKIGNNVNFQTGVYLAQDTIVGDDCFFSIHVGVLDEKYPAVGKQVRRPVVFGRNVVVGGGAKFIGGIRVGDNSVIGMGAMVIRDVSDNVVVAGVPAKIISTREEYDKKKRMWESESSKG